MTKYYHGTTADKVTLIEACGVLKPYGSVGVSKASGGLTTEKGLIWLTRNKCIAEYYAMGGSQTIEVSKGKIFSVRVPSYFRIIDRHQMLTMDQIAILNKMVPDYKQLDIGDTLSTFECRTNGFFGLKEALKSLGFDAVSFDDNKQLGFLIDSLEIENSDVID